MGRSQSRDSFAAVRYAVDTGSMPPQPKRSLWMRKRVVLPVAAATLLGAGLLASESRRQPDATTATLDCTSARDVWRPACRPDNLQDWVSRAASARDDAPAATGAVDDATKRASTPKRVVEAAKKAEPGTAPGSTPQAPAAQPAAPVMEPTTPKAAPRVATAPEASPEPARKPEAAKPAPEPVRAAEAKPEPRPAVPAAKLPEPQPVQQAAKSTEPQPARLVPPPVEPVKSPEPPAQQTTKLVEPQPAAKAAPPVEQVAKPEPQPTITAEPPRRPAPAPVKVAEEPAASAAAASAAQAETKARQKRLAERAARREAARTAALAERRLEPRVIVVRPDAEEPAPPRRLARAQPAEPGVRTTAHFPPGFVQALRHYNTRYAYGY